MVRFFKEEEEGSSSALQRFPRTGGFRRKMSPHELVQIRELCDLLDSPVDTPSTSGSCDPPRQRRNNKATAARVHTESGSESDMEMDPQGFPTIFKKEDHDSDEKSEGGSTYTYPSDGEPYIFKQQGQEDSESDDESFVPRVFKKNKTGRPSNSKAASLDAAMRPINPNPRTRKLTAKATKKQAKESRIMKKPSGKGPAMKVSNKFLDTKPEKYRLCITGEKPGRAEICGMVRDGAVLTRVHIFTLHEAGWGVNFAADAKRMLSRMRRDTLTKKQALAMRDSW